MRIAVLEDDIILRELIQATLERAGHAHQGYGQAGPLLRDLHRETFDLVLVDWHLPDMDGPEAVRAMRKIGPATMPIVFLTRRNTEQDVVQGLDCGADESMIKPVRMGELIARVNALLRRAYPAAMAGTLDFGRYRFDAPSRSIWVDGVQVALKNKEYEVALCLFQNMGRVLSHGHLQDMVWKEDAAEASSRALAVYASRLRSKLNLNAGGGFALTAVYGTGYRLDAQTGS